MILRQYIAVTVVLSLAMVLGGCVTGRGDGGGNGAAGGSLEEALAGLVPMPFSGTTTPTGTQGEYDEAVVAEATRMTALEMSHFNEAGEPLMRAGLMMTMSVRVGEKLEVEPMRVQVSGEGEINVPLVGAVECDGLTIGQLRSVLVEKYRGFYREPEVALSFLAEEGAPSPWGRILVQGRVAREGWINIPPTRDLTVSSAIQICGGYNTSAKKNSITVHRRGGDGKIEQILVNLDRVGRRGELERDIGLLPGDVVYVPESKY